MSEDLQDEITSINSIYGDETLFSLEPAHSIYSLTLPSQPSIAIRIEFPPSYPSVPPSIHGTQSTGSATNKGDGTHLVALLRAVLGEIYVPGAPCIFDLIEETTTRLPTQLKPQENTPTIADETSTPRTDNLPSGSIPYLSSQHETPPPWVLSDVVTEKKSVFVARAAPVTSVGQARLYVAQLLANDKKVAKATHNITAWRIRGEGGVQFQDCDDDGETAAGGRVLHLLELMGVWDVMVVVTRWYGGVQLGPDRFRIINQCARESVVRIGEGEEEGLEGRKRRGGK